MILIDPSVELITETDFYEHVAKCARVCYASDNSNISGKEFCNNVLIPKGHFSMFRHSTVYLKYPIDQHIQTVITNYSFNKFVKFIEHNQNLYIIANGNSLIDLVKGNYITIEDIEKHKIDDLPKELLKYKRFTFKVTTQISTSRELNRVSPNSIAERSTRYCNYTKDKFGCQISICKPYYYDDLPIQEQLAFINRMNDYEMNYIARVQRGWKPEDAREFLPLCTATEVVYTYSYEEWKDIIDKRVYNSTGKAHPNATIICKMIEDILNSYK